ncbi:MAG TPA: bifunctional 4'-phosphopantothenoylcysteine decarboxylase/phosphopantothenoylcysteine synthetase, partial [Planctomycetes bacterium]|nr:bifunctional 4'-phosphopantothenoylcysteine decarboxylase/phosphopantothenoylcysteine synthetase [Planctomycetota bacterium]
VSPQLFEALTGEPAACTEFGPERRGAMDHIELAGWGELLLVAPATADLVARLALGLAGDLLSTLALAYPAGAPRVLVPAMNPQMWAAPVVQRNAETLRADGWRILEPVAGHLACGDEGKGRMMEPAAILEALSDTLGG